MKCLVLFLLLVTTNNLLYASKCVPVAPECPSGVAETEPPSTPPSVCSGKGECVFGACNCNAGFGNPDCSATLRRTQLAALQITQGGFAEGPTRYFDIITQVAALLQQDAGLDIPAQDVLDDCTLAVVVSENVPLSDITLTLFEDTIGVNIVEGGIRTFGTAHMIIPKVPLTASVSTLPGFNSCCNSQGNPDQQSTSSCLVACSASAGDFVSFDMNATFSATVLPTFNETSGKVTIDVPTNLITVTFSPSDMGFELNCNLGSNIIDDIVSAFNGIIGEVVASQVQTKITQAAQELTNSFSVTGIAVPLTSDVSLTAFVPFAEFVADSHMNVLMEGVFTKERFFNQPSCPPVTTTFVDPTLDGQLQTTPGNTFFETDDNNQVTEFLFVTRLARSALNVGVAALTLDQTELINTLTSISLNFSLLDASFVANANVNFPEFAFPATNDLIGQGVGDFLQASLGGGAISLNCNDSALFASQFQSVAIDTKPLIIASLADNLLAFEGSADADFKITVQVFNLDVSNLDLTVSAPINVSIPNSLTVVVTNLLTGGAKLEAANQLLQEFAISIPGEISSLLPGPRITAAHDFQEPGSDGLNGFFEVSSRCLCGVPPTGDDLFFIVNSEAFGEEVIPLCVKECVGTGAPPPTVNTNPTPAQPSKNQGRRLVSAQQAQITEFLATGNCGKSQSQLSTATQAILTCAETVQDASFATNAVLLDCMKTIQDGSTDGNQFELGACDPTNSFFTSLAECPAQVGELMEDLFGQTCVAGPFFNCNSTLGEVFQADCFCESNPGDTSCNKIFVPLVVMVAGWIIPLVFHLILFFILRFCEGCCYRNGKALIVIDGNERAVSFFPVRLTRADKYYLSLSFLTVAAIAILTVGWIYSDPIIAMTNVVLSSTVFQTQFVRTSFDSFALGWSASILFSFAFVGSNYLAVSSYSYLVGRCAWVIPYAGSRYMTANGEMFLPNDRTIAVWSRNALRLQWSNRFAAFLLLTSIFAPAIFFPVRLSVTVTPPQFDPAQTTPPSSSSSSTTSDILGNLTSIATSQNTLDLMGEALGLTVMTSFLGFLSSLVFLIFQGAVPAMFSTATVALFWVDCQERYDLAVYTSQGGDMQSVLPPPDNSDQNRWRRILHYFAWSAHIGGAFGSLVAGILIYQTLQAPTAWAIVWIISWNATLPPLVSLVTRSNHHGPIQIISGQRRLITCVAYCLEFFTFTVVLIFLSPPQTSFASPLAVIFVVAVFLYAFLITLSEYANFGSLAVTNILKSDANIVERKSKTFEIGYSMAANGAQKQRIKSVVASKNGNVVYENQEFDWSAQNPTFQGGAAFASNNNNPSSMPAVNAPTSFNSWAPPIGQPISDFGKGSRISTVAMPYQTKIDGVAMKRAADRVSVRTLNNTNGKVAGYFGENDELRNQISRHLESRGIAGKAQSELTERIMAFHSSGQFQPQTNAQPTNLAPIAGGGNKFGQAYSNNFPQHSGGALKKAVARTRQSIRHWGEGYSSSTDQTDEQALICNNRIIDILLEGKENRDNTYGLRVVPYRRMLFFVGLVFLFTLQLNSTFNPLTVDSIKLFVLQATETFIDTSNLGVNVSQANISFATFDQATSSVNVPLQAFVNLSNGSFILLWIVFILFAISFFMDIYYTRSDKPNEIKRRGIRRARMFSFSTLPFLFVAIIVPSSAQYVELSIAGLVEATGLCNAPQFSALVLQIASQLFGLAMGGLLLIETMVVLMLVVPAHQRAIAFVVAREVFEIKRCKEGTKSYHTAEKQLNTARFIWRAFPMMSPVLLYIPIIMLAQLVAAVYSSILVYVFFVLPLITARLRRSERTSDQESYRWILFSGAWTGLYFLPLGIIGLVEVFTLNEFTFIEQVVLTDAFLYITVIAEVALAIVIVSDILYLFISPDAERQANEIIDSYADTVLKEAQNGRA